MTTATSIRPLALAAALLPACGDETGPSNLPPTASFTARCESLSCTFAAEGTDRDGTVEVWIWDFGDADGRATTRNATYTYASPGGRFNVTLTVIDDDGAVGRTSRTLEVNLANAAPTAAFAATCAPTPPPARTPSR